MSESNIKLPVSAPGIDATAGKVRALKGALGETGTEFSKWKDSLGEVANRFNAVMQAGEKLASGLKKGLELAHFSAELQNLEKKIPIATLRMMQQATEGAVDKVKLMKFAMTSLNGELKVTNTGLETVLKAANTLSDQGFGDTMQNAEKLMDVLRTGSTEALRKFGIAVQDTGDKTRDLHNAFGKVIDLAHTPIDVDPQLKQIERLQTGLKDMVGTVKSELGKVLIAFGEGLDDVSDKIAGVKSGPTSRGNAMLRNAKINAYMRRGVGWMGGDTYADAARWVDSGMSKDEFTMEEWARMAQDFGAQDRRMTSQDRTDAAMVHINRGIAHHQHGLGQMGKFREFKPEKAEKGAEKGMQLLEALSKIDDALGSDRENPWFGGMNVGLQGLRDLGSESRRHGMSDMILDPRARNFGDLRDRLGSGVKDEGMVNMGGFMTAASDEEKKLRAALGDTNTALGMGFSTLQDGIAASIDAAVTGSKSLVDALKGVASAALLSMSKRAAGEALFQTAWGFADLAALQPASAALHFKSAAIFGAAALAGGALAGALGGGGGGGGAGGSGSLPAGYTAQGASAGGGASSGGFGFGATTGSAWTRRHGGWSQQDAGAPGPTHVTVNVVGGAMASDQKKLGENIANATAAAQRANSGRTRGPTVITTRYE